MYVILVFFSFFPCMPDEAFCQPEYVCKYGVYGEYGVYELHVCMYVYVVTM